MSETNMQEQLNDYLKEAGQQHDFIEAVAYIRYSTHMQDSGVSIEYQMREISKYCEKNGFRIVRWFIDKALSAKTTAGREEFLRMFREFNAKTIPPNLILFAPNRVFRDAMDSSIYRERLRKMKVKLFSVMHTFDDETPMGRMATDILARIDQYKIEEVGEFVSAATKVLIENGLFAGGPVPIGFKKVITTFNGNERTKIVPDENYIETIRYIFDSFTAGRAIYNICHSLFDKGMFKPNGKPFERHDIRLMLSNPIYSGSRVYKMKNGEEVYCPDYCEAIIPKEQFTKAQNILKQNKNMAKGRKRKRIYPLTGKLVCHSCGYSLCARPIRNHYFYYACGNHKQTVGKCKLKAISKEWIEAAVFNAIKDNILSNEAINEIANIVMAKIKKTSASAEDKNMLLAKKKELELEIVELVEMKLKKTISEELFHTMKSSKDNELEPIDRKLAQLNAAFDSSLNKDTIKKNIKAIFDSAKAFEDCDPLALKDLFSQTVDKVVISDTQVEICLRIPFLQNLFNEKNEFPFSFLNKKIDR